MRYTWRDKRGYSQGKLWEGHPERVNALEVDQTSDARMR